MIKKPTCFITYCHEDNTREDVDFIINELKRRTKKDCDILYDQEIGIGKRFTAFMDALDVVDLVVMVCTPKYKERTEKGEGGVSYEYKKICERYERVLAERKEEVFNADEEDRNEFLGNMKINFFEILPIILKGGYNTSIPEKFSDYSALDLSYFRTITKKIGKTPHVYVPNSLEKRFNSDIAKVIEEIRVYNGLKQPAYEERLKKVYDDLKIETIFKNPKADFDNPKFNRSNYEDTLFVKTHAYKQIESQSAYFLVGRKGSGKSAISQVLSIKQRNRYEVVNIDVNRDAQLQILYAFVNKRLISDTTNVFRRIECFQYAWALFFRICIMDIIVSLFQQGTLSNFQKRASEEIRNFIATLNKGVDVTYPKTDKGNYFVYSFNSIERFMEDCFDSARPDLYLEDIANRNTMSQYFEFCLGKAVVAELEVFLENFKRKFLITFDGFDTEIEKFREEDVYAKDDSLESRVSFEIEWLHSLLLLVNDIKQMDRDLLSKKVDFCLMIPNHRYMEVIRDDADRYRYLHKRKFLIWSGIELALFLRKRLEIALNYPVKKSGDRRDPIETLHEIMSKRVNFLPEDIEFEFNNKWIRMPLFLYVLRHTLWRPRDILVYYAHLISIGLESLKNRHAVTSETMRISVANSTEYIIRDDFINEYKGTIRNFEDILNCFRRSNQTLTSEEIKEKIGEKDFDFIAVEHDKYRKDVLYKIKFLFQIGFLGVKVNDFVRLKNDPISDHVFIFNEGAKILNKVTLENLDEYDFILHPLFCEFLELNTKENEFLFEITWPYLKELEVYMQSSNDDFELFE